MHYNYCRIHQTLRVTPAMQAGLTDHVWELEELVARSVSIPNMTGPQIFWYITQS